MMQNPILKFRQSCFISEKPGCLSEKLKALTSSDYHIAWRLLYLHAQSLIFFDEILYTFPSYQCFQKGVRNFFLFCLDLELLINLVSVGVQKPGLFVFWQKTQVLNKIKSPTHPFVNIGKQGTCAKFLQKLRKFKAVDARQSFQFFRQNTSFHENSRTLFNVCMVFCIS